MKRNYSAQKRAALLLLSLSSLPLYGAPPNRSFNFSPGVSTPITTTTADAMDKGSIGLSLRTEYTRHREFPDTLLIEDLYVESRTSSSISFLMLNYGLEKDITLGLSLPYVAVNQIKAGQLSNDGFEITPHVLGSPAGIGDASIYSLWHYYEDEKTHLSMAFIAGLNTPTGKTTAQTNTGELFVISNQPGSGAWSPFGGLVVTKNWDNASLSGNLFYTQNTEGAQQTELGSLVDANLAAVFELYRGKKANFDIDGVVELIGEYAEVNHIAGIVEPNSGGAFLFFSPGIRMDIGTRSSFYLAGNFPLIENYVGTQVKTQYGVIAGVDFSLDADQKEDDKKEDKKSDRGK
jgi:hypothetical protein